MFCHLQHFPLESILPSNVCGWSILMTYKKRDLVDGNWSISVTHQIGDLMKIKISVPIRVVINRHSTKIVGKMCDRKPVAPI